MKQSYNELWSLIRLGQLPAGKLTIATILSVLAACGSLAYPLIAQQIVERLGDGARVGYLGLLLVVVLLAAALFGAIASLIISRIGHNVSTNLRGDLIHKMLRLPVGFFDKSHTGERVSRVLSDCNSISSLATKHSINFVNGLLMLFGSIAILLILDAHLTGVLLLTLFITFLVAAPAVVKMESISKEYQNYTAKLGGVLTHIFSEIRLVKSFSAEDHERERGNFIVKDLRDCGYRLDKLRIVLEEIVGIAVLAALVVILVYGGFRVGEGDLSMGALAAFILYIFNVASPMALIGSFFSELQTAKGASAHITQILKESDEQSLGGLETGERPRRVASLELKNVDFYYSTPDQIIFRKLNLIVEAGMTTALVGISGSGKSTLFSLIERFYEPTEGSISYDGLPIGNFNLKDWRKCIGYVSQNSPIMPGSVRDNITYGLEGDFSDSEVRDAARKASALEFIMRLPYGFETQLIEQGFNISGGERQRIAIARMFLRNPFLLLLDEATSSLDSETEHDINSALETLMEGRTSIVIAHRLSTIVQADRIAFLDGGQITGLGKHDELYRKHEVYARLVNRQFLNDDK